MTHDLLIIETVTACNAFPLPVMRFYLGKELNNDPTNFWAPNTICLRRMLADIGFRRVEIVRNMYSVPSVSRHFAFASKRRHQGCSPLCTAVIARAEARSGAQEACGAALENAVGLAH